MPPSNVVKLNFDDAKPQGYYASRQLDDPHYVQDLKARLESQAASVLSYLWPNGRLVGHEFHVGSIHGESGDSLKVSLRPGKVGVGSDFAGNAVCGDLLDCWAYATAGRKARGRDFADLCETIEQWTGRPFKAPPRPAEKAKPADFGPPTAQYTYTDEAGAALVVVYRHEMAELDKRGKPKKEFRPWDVARRAYKAPEQDRPLYNRAGIKGEPWVVFVEGEGKADALIKLGIAATCAMGGSKAPVEKSDWTPLEGKHVIIWPDADEEGQAFAEKVRERLGSVAALVAMVQPPAGKPKGWDAADAIAEGMDPRAIINTAVQKPKGRHLAISEWQSGTFAGAAKPVEWLVDGFIPLGTAGLLAAMGDAGKGILTLDLALKVALPKPEGGIVDDGPLCMGARVVATGPVVILAAEDDRDEIHRRLERLDTEHRRPNNLYLVPLPNAGGPLPIVKTSSTQGPFITPEWEALRAQLVELAPKLIVLDPLASFVHADINADPAAGAFVTGTLASLATETGAAVLVCHHMAKSRQPMTTPEEARSMIRGSSALVDGVRFAIALWQADEDDARRVCGALNTEWHRGRVFKGAVVKSNAPADRNIKLFVRDMATGLLVDQSGRLATNKGFQRDLDLEELTAAISTAAAAGFPYSYSGSTGVHERRGELPERFAVMGKHTLRGLVDSLIERGAVKRVRYGKGVASPWLDEPDGDFARGFVELKQGAYQEDIK